MSQVQVLVCGFTAADGVSKTGSNYGFSQVEYLVPQESFKNDKHSFRKVGFEVKTISVAHTPEVENQFMNIPTMKQVNLTIQPDPTNMNKNLCVAWEAVK